MTQLKRSLVKKVKKIIAYLKITIKNQIRIKNSYNHNNNNKKNNNNKNNHQTKILIFLKIRIPKNKISIKIQPYNKMIFYNFQTLQYRNNSNNN